MKCINVIYFGLTTELLTGSVIAEPSTPMRTAGKSVSKFICLSKS